MESLVQAKKGDARGLWKDKGLSSVCGKLMVATSGKRTRRELEGVSNVRTSAIAGNVSKNVNSSTVLSNLLLDYLVAGLIV